MKYVIHKRPMSKRDVLRAMRDNGYVEGVVAVKLYDILEAGGEDGFLCLLNKKLVGDEVSLDDMEYEVVGVQYPSILHIRVRAVAYVHEIRHEP